MELEGQVQLGMHRKKGGGRGHRYGTRVRCVKTGDSEAEGGGVSMQWAGLRAAATPHLELALQCKRLLRKKAQWCNTPVQFAQCSA